MFVRFAHLPINIEFNLPTSSYNSLNQSEAITPAFAASSCVWTLTGRTESTQACTWSSIRHIWWSMPAVSKGHCRKFHWPWQGPFTIVKVIDNCVYRIQSNFTHLPNAWWFTIISWSHKTHPLTRMFIAQTAISQSIITLYKSQQQEEQEFQKSEVEIISDAGNSHNVPKHNETLQDSTNLVHLFRCLHRTCRPPDRYRESIQYQGSPQLWLTRLKD